MANAKVLALLLGLILVIEAVSVLGSRQPLDEQDAGTVDRRKKKKKHPYTSPEGLFIQERASKQLPGPGQHFSFGALKPWEDIHAMIEGKEDHKLLLVVRHGQAISNYLGDTLGPDEWFVVEGTCQYDDKQGTIYNIFDADLTGLGEDQAKSLNSILVGGGWFSKMTADKPVRAIISPLTRCLHTASLVMQDIKPNATNVEEFVRETLGEDTCDARRSVSDPNPSASPSVDRRAPEPPCSFDKGLASTYPQFKYRVYDPRDDADRGFGLLGDADHLWTKERRERQKHQVKRAKKFLDILFEHAPEQVVIVVTHSGFTRSLLLAVQREPYRPQNAEMVPVVVRKSSRDDDRNSAASGQRAAAAEEDDSWLEEVLQGYEDLELERDSSSSSAEGSGSGSAGAKKHGSGSCMLGKMVNRLMGMMWGGGQQQQGISSQ